MTEPVTITILGAPVGWARSGGGKNTHRFTPAKQRSYAERVSGAGQDAMLGRLPMAGPIALTLRAVLKIPSSWSPKKHAAALTGALLPTVKPDFDNLMKGVADALNKIIWLDDKQIVRSTFEKVYGPQPMLVLTAREIVPALEELLS